MKKILFLGILTMSLFTLSACENETPMVSEQESPVMMAGEYLGSEYKGNYVWGLAMNLAWQDLNENILKSKLQLNTQDPVVLKMVSAFNQAPFSKQDLDAESYYIKSGYGQKTVDSINKESKEKFPSKSFADLKINLEDRGIIAYAYFLKQVEYLTAFEKAEEPLLFDNKKVKAFEAAESEQRENIEVLHYENDEKFILKLKLKDQKDEMILAKGYDMSHPQEAMEAISKNPLEYWTSMSYADTFIAPLLHLDYHRDYSELTGIPLTNQGFESYAIAQMFEKIKFDMDEKGARVENEAVIATTDAYAGPSEYQEPPRRNFILDKAYWVFMKRTDSPNPYFILGVKNTELMERSE